MKLTKEMREDVIRKCVDATFKDRDAKYDKSRTILADDLYAHAFGEHEKAAKKLPAGWVVSHREVCINMDGFRGPWSRDKNRPLNTLKTSKDHLFPASIGNAFTVNKDHTLHDQAQATINEFHAIAKAKDELRSQLQTLLYSVNTLERLKEVWPEGIKHFPGEPKKVTAVIPYDLTLSINKIMGIAA